MAGADLVLAPLRGTGQEKERAAGHESLADKPLVLVWQGCQLEVYAHTPLDLLPGVNRIENTYCEEIGIVIKDRGEEVNAALLIAGNVVRFST